ncbi:ClpP/crotonase-like domain-containing protein [Chytridium lagenaria]|nr:ClpP/crotonase-like domain-containing protein [Chytridium lagenaria]
MAKRMGRFGLNFVRIGLRPGMGGMHMVPRVTNPQVTSRLILTGDLVDAKEAASLGLILKSVPGPSLLPECLTFVRRIASASPIAVQEADTQGLAYGSGDMTEGLDAIEEGREPRFEDFGMEEGL